MALMFIAEYEDLARDGQGNIIQAGQEPPLAKQYIDFTSAVASSAAFHSSTKFVRIFLDTAGYLKFGASPQTAVTAQDTPLAASVGEFFGVKGGQIVSVIQ